MTARQKNSMGGRDHHISVRAVRRSQPDVRRLSRALIALAMAQAAEEAAAEAHGKQERGDRHV